MYVVRTFAQARHILDNIEPGSSSHCLSVERHTDGSAYVQHVRLGVRIFVEAY
jgi:hypothetical protein